MLLLLHVDGVYRFTDKKRCKMIGINPFRGLLFAVASLGKKLSFFSVKFGK